MREKTPTPFQLPFPESPWAEQGSQSSRQNQKKGAAFQPCPFCSDALRGGGGGGREDKQESQAENCPDEIPGCHLTHGIGWNK